MTPRILGYGKDYTWLEDPNTREKQEETFDLTQIKDKELNEKLFKKGQNEFSFDLPHQVNITFKLLNHKDEKDRRGVKTH